MSPKKWSKEEGAYLREIVSGRSYKEITTLLAERFTDQTYTESIVRSAIRNRKLSTGRTGRFETGNVSHNKGLKQSDFMSAEAIERTKAARFKRGNLPHNHREIGEERLTVDGYVEVKVSMFRHKNPNDCWLFKHRLVWEEAHGEIPEKYAITFKDGNRQNCELDNLMLISRRELARLNQQDLLGHSREISETGLALVKLQIGMTERMAR